MAERSEVSNRNAYILYITHYMKNSNAENNNRLIIASYRKSSTSASADSLRAYVERNYYRKNLLKSIGGDLTI